MQTIPNALDTDDVQAKIRLVHAEQGDVPIQVVVIYANQVVARGQIHNALMNYEGGTRRLELQVQATEFREPDPAKILHDAVFVTDLPGVGERRYDVQVAGPVPPEGRTEVINGVSGRVLPAGS